MRIDLQALLQQARQAKQEGQQVVGLAVDDVVELAGRISKAEAEAAGFKQIVGAEVLRCQPGDVVLVNMDAKWLGGSQEYEFYRNGLLSVLPAGVKAITKVAGVDFSVLTDEQLAAAGLGRVPASQFHIGKPVKKVTGEYKISGVVRSVFTKGDGGVRLVVEHTVKDEHGEGSFLHIYGPANLEPLTQGGAA